MQQLLSLLHSQGPQWLPTLSSLRRLRCRGRELRAAAGRALVFESPVVEAGVSEWDRRGRALLAVSDEGSALLVMEEWKERSEAML